MNQDYIKPDNCPSLKRDLTAKALNRPESLFPALVMEPWDSQTLRNTILVTFKEVT
jgi:hypothetical protein